jgi:hypothetical protein
MAGTGQTVPSQAARRNGCFAQNQSLQPGQTDIASRTAGLRPTVAVGPSPPLRKRMSSRAEEFHLRALPEPCVNLSIHTAPDVRPLP